MLIDDNEAILGFLDIRVTDKYIVALYSGESLLTAEYESDIIKVYTLDGELLESHFLDTKISQIALDDQYNRLVAISYYPMPSVYLLLF